MASDTVWLVLLLASTVHGMAFRPSTRNETSRSLAPEDEELLVQILSYKASNLGTLMQSGRKFLQKVREWHGTHPAESILAKCILHYWIEVKIPGIVATADEDVYEDGKRGLSTPVWIEGDTPEGEPQALANFQDSIAGQDASNRILDNDDSVGEVTGTHPSFRSFNDDGKFTFKRKAVKALYMLYMELKDILTEFKLVGCSVHYLIAKFWEWVDNAP